MMSRSTTPNSGFSRIPPIVTNETDRSFLKNVDSYIKYELGQVDPEDPEQCYVIYKSVFNKIIEHVTAYQPLLTTIKKQYEDTIDAVKKGQREVAFLNNKLKAMASEPSTLRNYRKRGDELEERIAIVRHDNERLQRHLDELRVTRQEAEQKQKEVHEPPKRELKKDHRQIPGLSLEESTDIDLLQKKLDKLDRQLKELNISFKTRYIPKTTKVELKEHLDNKVNHRDELLQQVQHYKAKRHKMKIAMDAAQAYNKIKPPHQTVGDAVIYALAQALGKLRHELPPGDHSHGDLIGGRDGSPPTVTTTFEDDDPNKEQEAELMLEYIEKFNELFEDGMYEEAATHAANSPKGILRTPATLAKFKEVRSKVSSRSPLLAFCDALMSSVVAVGVRPNDVLSLECVNCVLNESRLDLLVHWLAQDRLALTKEIGDAIRDHCRCSLVCKCSCQALAQNVYARMGLHRDAVICMLHQGRVHAGIDHAKQKSPFTKPDYVEVLRKCYTTQLASIIVNSDAEGRRALPIGRVIKTLLEGDNFEGVLHLIHDLHYGVNQDGVEHTDFHNAVFADRETTPDEWAEIMKVLQDHGCEETAIEMFAAITVQTAIRKAFSETALIKSTESLV